MVRWRGGEAVRNVRAGYIFRISSAVPRMVDIPLPRPPSGEEWAASVESSCCPSARGLWRWGGVGGRRFLALGGWGQLQCIEGTEGTAGVEGMRCMVRGAAHLARVANIQITLVAAVKGGVFGDRGTAHRAAENPESRVVG